MSDPKFTCIFCDDVRKEEGAKVSYMGVYDGSIIFPQQPAHKPTFSFVLKLTTAIEDDVCEIEFEVTDDNELAIVTSLSKEEVENSRKEILETADDASVLSVKCVIQVGGMSFTEQRKIRTFAKFNNKTLEGDSLQVVFA